MIRCTQCREPLPEAARFCPNCGAARARKRQHAASETAVPSDPLLHARSVMREDGEEILWTGRFSVRGLIHSWLLAVLLSIVMPLGGLWVQAERTQWLVIGGVLAAVWLGLTGLLVFQKLNVRYVLTSRRLIHRSGIIVQRTDRLELIDMSDVSHQQSIIERIFNVGTIEVTTSDHSHPYIELPGIGDVAGVAMLIDDARLRERARRGVHVEQI